MLMKSFLIEYSYSKSLPLDSETPGAEYWIEFIESLNFW